LIDFFNYITAHKGRESIILKGWEKAGIVGLFDGTTKIPADDSFNMFYT